MCPILMSALSSRHGSCKHAYRRQLAALGPFLAAWCHQCQPSWSLAGQVSSYFSAEVSEKRDRSSWPPSSSCHLGLSGLLRRSRSWASLGSSGPTLKSHAAYAVRSGVFKLWSPSVRMAVCVGLASVSNASERVEFHVSERDGLRSIIMIGCLELPPAPPSQWSPNLRPVMSRIRVETRSGVGSSW